MDTEVRNHHKALIELAFEPIFVREFNGRILEWNHGAQELYGYTPEEAVGTVSHDLLHTRFPTSRTDLEQTLEHDNRWRGALIHTDRNGHHIAVESSQQLYALPDGTRVVLEMNHVIHPAPPDSRLLENKPQWLDIASQLHMDDHADNLSLLAQKFSHTLPDHAGQPANLTALAADISERMRAETALRESETRLQLALDGGEMGTWVWDLATDRVVWDRREHELFGIDEQAFTGEGEEAIRHIHPDDRERISLAVSRAVFDSKPFREEFRVVLADGSVRWLAGRAQPIPNEQGRITRIVGVNFDITPRKEAELAREHRHEEELARLYRIGTVNELAGGLAHELSQPLTAIQNYAGGCIKWVNNGGSPSQLLTALQAISEQSQRVVDIIRHLRRLMVSGEPQRTLTDLTTLVRRAHNLLQVPLARKNVQFLVEAEPALPAVPVDALQIEQVLIILIRNSIDAFTAATPAHPLVQVHLRRRGEMVVIDVRDNGPGVPPEALDRMFKPFYTTKTHGTGLGLMLAHGLIKAHLGDIRVLLPDGGGLTVRITLPISVLTHG